MITAKQIAELNALLDARGIGASTRQAFAIEPCVTRVDGKDVLAWRYPTYSLDSAGESTRWRYKIPNHKAQGVRKYSWEYPLPKGTTNDHWRLYLPLGMGAVVEAVKLCGGKLHTPRGEPDFWTLHAASGMFPPAVSFFGEGITIPTWFVAFCRDIGVTQVIDFPDLDDAGLGQAQRLYRAFDNSGIAYAAQRFPEGVGKDNNDLWIHVKNDAKAFWNVRKSCAMIEYTQTTQETPPAPVRREIGAFYNDDSQAMDIKNMVDGVEFIRSRGVTLERKGNVYQGLCPFHSEKTASFTVYKDGYKCFGCGRHGDVFQFVMEQKQCDFPAALQEVADYAGVTLVERVNAKHVNLDAAPQSNGTRLQVAQAVTPTVNGKHSEPPRDSIQFLSSQEIGIQPLRGVQFPLAVLRDWGGFWKGCPLGMVALLIGGTGTGKTILLETLLEAWCKMGISSLIFSPEWRKGLFRARREQRRTGYDTIPLVAIPERIAHDQWVWENAENIPQGHRWGTPLTEAQQRALRGAQYTLDHPDDGDGEIYCYDDDSANGFYLSHVLNAMEKRIVELRKQGKRLDVVGIDYIQRLQNGRDKFKNDYEGMMHEIQAWALRVGVIVVLMCQVTKASGKSAKWENTTLDASDAQNVRADVSQLAMTITIQYEERLDEYGKKYMRQVTNEYGEGLVKLTCVKNSMGEGREAYVYVNYNRLFYRGEGVPFRDTDMPEGGEDVPF